MSGWFIERENFPKQSHRLLPGKYKLGRLHSCNIICNDKMVSRRHCEVYINKSGKRGFIMDFSGNGTYINGKKINKFGCYELFSGDRIGLSLPAGYKAPGQDRENCYSFMIMNIHPIEESLKPKVNKTNNQNLDHTKKSKSTKNSNTDESVKILQKLHIESIEADKKRKSEKFIATDSSEKNLENIVKNKDADKLVKNQEKSSEEDIDVKKTRKSERLKENDSNQKNHENATKNINNNISDKSQEKYSKDDIDKTRKSERLKETDSHQKVPENATNNENNKTPDKNQEKSLEGNNDADKTRNKSERIKEIVLNEKISAKNKTTEKEPTDDVSSTAENRKELTKSDSKETNTESNKNDFIFISPDPGDDEPFEVTTLEIVILNGNQKNINLKNRHSNKRKSNTFMSEIQEEKSARKNETAKINKLALKKTKDNVQNDIIDLLNEVEENTDILENKNIEEPKGPILNNKSSENQDAKSAQVSDAETKFSKHRKSVIISPSEIEDKLSKTDVDNKKEKNNAVDASDRVQDSERIMKTKNCKESGENNLCEINLNDEINHPDVFSSENQENVKLLGVTDAEKINKSTNENTLKEKSSKKRKSVTFESSEIEEKRSSRIEVDINKETQSESSGDVSSKKKSLKVGTNDLADTSNDSQNVATSENISIKKTRSNSMLSESDSNEKSSKRSSTESCEIIQDSQEFASSGKIIKKSPRSKLEKIIAKQITPKKERKSTILIPSIFECDMSSEKGKGSENPKLRTSPFPKKWKIRYIPISSKIQDKSINENVTSSQNEKEIETSNGSTSNGNNTKKKNARILPPISRDTRSNSNITGSGIAKSKRLKPNQASPKYLTNMFFTTSVKKNSVPTKIISSTEKATRHKKLKELAMKEKSKKSEIPQKEKKAPFVAKVTHKNRGAFLL